MSIVLLFTGFKCILTDYILLDCISFIQVLQAAISRDSRGPAAISRDSRGVLSACALSLFNPSFFFAEMLGYGHFNVSCKRLA